MSNLSTRVLKINHLNIQSLSNKLEELKHYLAYNQIDILTLNETLLNKQIVISPPIQGYTLYRRDRDGPGGGVAILIRDCIPSSLVRLPSLPADFEALTIQIPKSLHQNQDLIISTIYNTHQPINRSALECVLNSGENVLLIGDLNAHHPLWFGAETNKSGSIIFDILENNFAILNTNAGTYAPLHRPNYQSVIDLAICSDSLISSCHSFEVSDEIRSDHLCVQLKVNAPGLPLASKETVNVKKLNMDALTSLRQDSVI